VERNTIQVLHAVSGALRRPEAEAVVVLGGDDDAFYAGLFGNPHPLPAIQLSGVENFGAFRAVPPFQVGEGVDVEVYEGVITRRAAVPRGWHRRGRGEWAG